MKLDKTQLLLLGVLVVLIIGLFVGRTVKTSFLGSVSEADGYYSTTTIAQISPSPITLKNGPGILGSVVITKSGTGAFSYYDATTSDITKRGNIPTTTLVIAGIPTSPTVGTYVYDITFKYGLLVDYTNTVGTTTTTWK